MAIAVSFTFLVILYLDNCCLNRPFDDQLQLRVFVEAEAVLAVILMVDCGIHTLCRSFAIDFEIDKIVDPVRLYEVSRLADKARHFQSVTNEVMQRAAEIHALGIRRLDAAHIACAEALRATVFLTTDDRLLKTARRNAGRIHVLVENPATWMTMSHEQDG